MSKLSRFISVLLDEADRLEDRIRYDRVMADELPIYAAFDRMYLKELEAATPRDEPRILDWRGRCLRWDQEIWGHEESLRGAQARLLWIWGEIQRLSGDVSSVWSVDALSKRSIFRP